MRVARVSQKGEAQSDLGIGTGSARPIRAASRRRRKRKGGGIETPLVRAAKLGDSQLRGRGKAGCRRPDRLVLPCSIERQERGALLTIARRELVACREPFGKLGSEADGGGRSRWCPGICRLGGLLGRSCHRRRLGPNRRHRKRPPATPRTRAKNGRRRDSMLSSSLCGAGYRSCMANARPGGPRSVPGVAGRSQQSCASEDWSALLRNGLVCACKKGCRPNASIEQKWGSETPWISTTTSLSEQARRGRCWHRG